MNKITDEHLGRSAYVYVRQSTIGQVHQNVDSQKRQYGLKIRAQELGWRDVLTIDEDLGRSGSGSARPGFDRLVMAISRGEVGAVFAVEASRLARNGRDWHTLLEFCAVVGTLIIDEDEVYDPRRGTDQMVLGLKGAFSVMELSAIHQRAHEALEQMAKRGELFTMVAVGYVVTPDNRLVKDPDRRVQEAISLVFTKFRELGSVRQVLLWLRKENISLPTRSIGTPGRPLVWKSPSYDQALRILENPVYAGAYAYGRRKRAVRLDERRHRVYYNIRLPREKWRFLLRDRHEGYIDWDEYEHNRQLIANNAARKGEMAQGAVRGGAALLAGLLRCGHCGRKLRVNYGNNRYAASYGCVSRPEEALTPVVCMSIGSRHIEPPISEEVLRILQPLGIEAALAAIKDGEDQNRGQRHQIELALEAARYQVALARRQYDAIDPDNRLVAGELERRWNERLVAAQQLEVRLAALSDDVGSRLSPAENKQLMELGRDISAAWNHPAASIEIKKRILRTVIREIIVRIQDDDVHVLIHWHGGDHTPLEIARKLRGRWRAPKVVEAEEETGGLITSLARIMPDSNIAILLNRLRRRTISGLTWTQDRVRVFRVKHGVSAYREGERAERQELILDDAVQEFGFAKMTLVRGIRAGKLAARQLCPGGPYIICRKDMELFAARRAPIPDPVSADTQQLSLEFQ